MYFLFTSWQQIDKISKLTHFPPPALQDLVGKMDFRETSDRTISIKKYVVFNCNRLILCTTGLSTNSARLEETKVEIINLKKELTGDLDLFRKDLRIS